MRKDGRGAIDPRQHPPTPCHLPPPPAGKLLHHHCMNTRTTRKSGVFLTEFLFLSTGPVVGIDLGTHQLIVVVMEGKTGIIDMQVEVQMTLQLVQ